MSADRELTRIVRSWLQTDEHESVDRVLDVVFGRLDTTPQRRPFGRAWRTQFMSRTFKLAAAGLGVVLVAALAFALYYGRPTAPAAGPTATHASSHSRGPTAVAVAPVEPTPHTTPPPATASPTPAPASLLPNRRMPGTTFSPAGEYGWQGSPGGEDTAGMHWFNKQGRTGRELADMVFMVGSECDTAPIAGRGDSSIPVRVAGYDAVYVEPYEPAVSYNSPAGDETSRAYKVDVDGRALCVFVTWHATTTDRQRESLWDVIDSLRAQTIGTDGIRITFELGEGWDIG